MSIKRRKKRIYRQVPRAEILRERELDRVLEKEKIIGKKIRTGDRVCVISGNSKGEHGLVIGFNADRVLISGVNLRVKHQKRSEQNPKGIFSMEAPVHRSNVCLCDENGVPYKQVKVAFDESGKKVLTAVNANGDSVTLRSMKTLNK